MKIYIAANVTNVVIFNISSTKTISIVRKLFKIILRKSYKSSREIDLVVSVSTEYKNMTNIGCECESSASQYLVYT